MFAVSRLWLVFDAAFMVQKDLSSMMFPSISSTLTRMLGADSENSDPQFMQILDSVIKYRRVKNPADI